MYVDGYLTPVPQIKKDAFRPWQHGAASILKGYGATRVVECWSDDSSSIPDEFYQGEVTFRSLDRYPRRCRLQSRKTI